MGEKSSNPVTLPTFFYFFLMYWRVAGKDNDSVFGPG
jgi:hypothetical protein